MRFWGTRGSLPTPGPETVRYGGNTSCVEVRGPDGTVLVLDAGTGIRRLGATLVDAARRVDLLVTHLHLDHIIGLGFFAPLYVPGLEVHLWAPTGTREPLPQRLARYLSPPLFPVRMRDLPCRLTLHEVPRGDLALGPFRVTTALVCHPGPTVGYRIAAADASLCYLPDHEPALGLRRFPIAPEWTSGYALAAGVDLLIHDAQYSAVEYRRRVGWGHSSLDHALAFARLAGVRHLVLFHHDPGHQDEALERLVADALARARPPCRVSLATEGQALTLPGAG